MRTTQPYQLLLLAVSLLNCADILYGQVNQTGEVPDHFLPFGDLLGDSIVPHLDDTSSGAIPLSAGIRFFGTTYNQIYVNTNGLLSFIFSVTSATSSGSFDSHPFPLIAPFWDDVNVAINGTIYYREDFDPMTAVRLRREISVEYPEAETFNPSVVFVATWDRVASFHFEFRGLRNTFQAVIASDGNMTFVLFNYGDIQWGGMSTLIGVNAGDGVNFVIHPSSFNTQVQLLDNTTVSYRVDSPTNTTVPPTDTTNTTVPPTDTTNTTVPPTQPGFCEEFEIRSTTRSTSVTVGDITNPGNVFVVEGNIEICIDGFFYSICDEGWDDAEAQLVCDYLGYESKAYVGTAVRGLPSEPPIIAENASCPSNATHPSQCSYTSPPVTPRCFGPSSAAGFRCTQVRTPCIFEGEIAVFNPTYENYLNIFTGGPLSFSGKVGVCRDGVYDSICDVNWDENDAKVLCQSLGVRGSTPLRGLSAGLDPISLEEINCNGSESSIQDCPTSLIGELSPTCREPNRAAGVTCSVPEGDCVDPIGVRLVDGPNFYEGRFEVCRNNSWLSVCDVGVDQLALTACEARGHFGDDVTPVFGSGYGPGTGPQLAVCPGSSFLDIIPVEECTTNPELKDLCSHERDAGVRCQPGLLSMFNTSSGLPILGSPFTLECFAQQLPWEAKLVADEWSRFGVPVQLGDSVLYTLLQDSYGASVFNLTYTYRSQLIFDRPLQLSDRGEYSCNVTVELRYPDNSTYLLTNSTSYPVVVQVPSANISVEFNGSQLVDTRLDVHCFVELIDPDLADYIMIDFFDGSFHNISAILEQVPPELARLRLSRVSQYNETHVVRTITAMPLLEEDQDNYFCILNYNLNDSYVNAFSTAHAFHLRVFFNDTEDLTTHFLPFGDLVGDSIVPSSDDGTTGAIQLSAGIPFFGTTYDQIYVNTNGLLSFNVSVTSPSSFGNFDNHRFPLIAPFWDDVNVAINGTIYYREDFDPTTADRLRREISAEYPEAGTFNPSIVFVATWDRVEPFVSQFRGLRNTFQVVVASDGSMTFVLFNYGDIQWGGVNTLIGVSAGDRVNFVIHPASFTTRVLLLDNSTISYTVDSVLPLPPPIGVQGLCSVVVWSSPDIPCNNISSYDVRLYHSRQPQLSLNRQVPPNGTYYIIRDGDKLTGVPSSEVYVQVRFVHTSGGIGDWSEGISLGCEEPTDPVVQRVYFELKGDVYGNNSVISLSEIGEGAADALHCITDNEACCQTRPNRIGEFYYPNGVKVPIARFRHGFYRNRGDKAVLLNRREGVQSPTGRYRCEIPNADGVLENIYITIA